MRRFAFFAGMLACIACVAGSTACGGAPEQGASAPTTIAPQAVSGEAAPAPQEDSRFASDVATPPPPRPMRQIDRPEGAELRKADVRAVDKTLPADGTGSGTTASNAQTQTEAPHDVAMLVYTAHVTMAVYQVANALDAIESVARGFGGYLASRNDTQIQIRIPRARFDEALKRVEASGDVVHREVSAQDVTDAYVDIEARLKNARAVRDRLQALLEKAAVKEAIEIQRELERVTGDIESLEGKLKLLANRVAYSTIDVTFEARGNAALHGTPFRLPFPWLSELGLPHLLDMTGSGSQ
jgi:hypothetical protein